jgi:hypothetical protein
MVGETPITFTAKYLMDFAAENRAAGNALWLNLCVKL